MPRFPGSASNCSNNNNNHLCTCHFNRTCQLHKCHCKKCRKHTTMAKGVTCKWRQLHRKFYKKNMSTAMRQKYDYGQKAVIKKYNMHNKPASFTARVMDLLALMSAKYGSKFHEFGMVDTSQSVNMCGARADGACSTLATSSEIFLCKLGSQLLCAGLLVDAPAAVFARSLIIALLSYIS